MYNCAITVSTLYRIYLNFTTDSGFLNFRFIANAESCLFLEFNLSMYLKERAFMQRQRHIHFSLTYVSHAMATLTYCLLTTFVHNRLIIVRVVLYSGYWRHFISFYGLRKCTMSGREICRSQEGNWFG